MKKIIPIITFLVLMSPLVSMAAITFGGNVTLGGSGTYLPASQYGSTNGSNGLAGSSGTQCSSSRSLTLCTIINSVITYLNEALFLLIALSVVIFVYYVFKYFIMPNENRKEAGTYVMYSVIGFFVILSMWGLVNILQNTFGIGNSGFAHSSWTDISNIIPK